VDLPATNAPMAAGRSPQLQLQHRAPRPIARRPRASGGAGALPSHGDRL
jgi:hypothetical protein